jgi:hypothetical protein
VDIDELWATLLQLSTMGGFDLLLVSVIFYWPTHGRPFTSKVAKPEAWL